LDVNKKKFNSTTFQFWVKQSAVRVFLFKWKCGWTLWYCVW